MSYAPSHRYHRHLLSMQTTQHYMLMTDKTWSNWYATVNQYLLKITYNSTNLKPIILPSIKKTILGNLLNSWVHYLGLWKMWPLVLMLQTEHLASFPGNSLSSRVNKFSVQIPPVLLYNCGLCTLTSQLSNSLHVWHRCKLRFLLGIPTKDHINNTTLYE